MSSHNQIYNLLYHWTERSTWKSKRKSPGSFQISLALKKQQVCPRTRISCLQALQYLLYWSSHFPFHDELLQVFIPRMYYNYRYENRGSRNQPPYCLLQLQEKKEHSATPGGVVLGLPSPSPRVCTDVRWRQNQNFSAQRLYTKFACPWCSASSAIILFLLNDKIQ